MPGYRRNAELTAEQAELLEEIVNDEPSDVALEKLERSVESFQYTSTLLASLAALYLDEYHDVDGNLLLLRFAEEFAEHEARTL